MTAMSTTPRYGIFEWSRPHPVTPGVFAVPIEATFTHEPTARAIRVPGFHDGRGSHCVRFMPDMAGTWNYLVKIDGREAGDGAFACVESGLVGPLRIDPAHPYHLVHESGEPFYLMGTTAYNTISTHRNAPARFQEFLDYSRDRGFNWVRLLLEQTKWPTHGEGVWPWGGTPENPDFTVFDPATFEAAESVLDALAGRDMIASLILLHPGDPVFKGRTGLADLFIPLVRYAVARLGAYRNVVWNVANEWMRDFNLVTGDLDRIGEAVREADPYRRLIAVHDFARFEFADRPWCDISSMQHRGLPGEINRIALQNRVFGKPVINEEYGYEGDNLVPPNDPDNVRHDHWALALAGAYGSYGDKTKGPKIGVYFSADMDDSIGAAVPDVLMHLRTFMERTGYRELTPCNDYLSDCRRDQVFCLVNPGREYIVYLSEGQPFRLNLTHAQGTMTAQWYNPRNGEYGDRFPVRVPQDRSDIAGQDPGDLAWHAFFGRQNMEFKAPDREDWVLWLRKEDGMGES